LGGHAVAFHGHPRFTGDIDFFIRRTVENAQRVLDAVSDFGFGSIGLARDDLLNAGQVIQLGRPPNRIDILTSISGVDFDDAWRARVPAELDGEPVHFLGWDHLLDNKRASDRTKDRADVEKLLAVARRKGAG
jgi:hypothetical protein